MTLGIISREVRMKMRGFKPFLSGIVGVAGMLLALPAYAQTGGTGGGNTECLRENNCGTPDMVGGGTCSCSCGCSVRIHYTDTGVTFDTTDDYDQDGVKDAVDDCPAFFDPQQDALVRNGGKCPDSANTGSATAGDPLADVPVTGNGSMTQPTTAPTTAGGEPAANEAGCSVLRAHLAGKGAALVVFGSIFTIALIRTRRRSSRK
jgi:hypothetical protein